MEEKPLILFDMDGTLVKMQEGSLVDDLTDVFDGESMKRRMKEIAMFYGIPLEVLNDLDRLAHIWNSARRYVEINGFSESTIEDLMVDINHPFTLHESAEHDATVLIPGTIEILEALKREGYPMGLVTTASRGAYNRLSSNPEFGCFNKYFTYSITRDDCKYIKPDPEPIKRVLQMFNKTEFIYVGDSDHDAEATRAAGGKFILINTRRYNEEKIEELNPEFVINNLSELFNIF
jgi:HAD superfamily hydrolase (TIGR01549 family)